MKKLVIATHNPGKLALYKKYLSKIGYELFSLRDLGIEYDVPETGNTFQENAILKAQQYVKLSGLPTLADDGGIAVDALNGEPGIYSARYAGPDASDAQKVAFLLEKIKNISTEKRTAYFKAVLALVYPEQEPKIFEGIMKGRIAHHPRGRSQDGLPYRQIFIPEGYNKTIDELEELSDWSYVTHREQAIQKLLGYLKSC